MLEAPDDNFYDGQKGFDPVGSDNDDEPILIEESSKSLSHIDSPRPEDRLHVYKRRWYMLGLYCIANTICEALEFSIATVQDKAVEYYGVSDVMVSSLIMISFSITLSMLLVAAFLSERFGLFKTHVAGNILLFLGSWVRVIGFKQHGFPLVVISQAIYGFAFPCIVETTVTQMANNWFPENERATASSIVFVAMVAGTAGMELLGPAMVSGSGNSSIVSSIGNRSGEEQSLSELADAVLRAVNSDVEMKALENQFLRFYLVQAAVITVVALLTFTTFKGEPEKPPNFSSFIKKTSSASNNSMKGFAKAVLECFKTGPFYPLFLGYGIEYGAAEGMLTIMNPMLIPEGYTTKEAGYCGLAYFGIGFFGSFVAAAIADRTKMYKAVLRVSAIGIAGTAALVYTQIKPNNLLLLVLTMSLHSFFMNAVSATTFDALVEVTYPINETVTASLTSIFGCVLTVVLTNVFLSMKDDKPPYSLKKAFLLYVVLDIISCICYIFQFGANKRFETETSESTKSTETSHMTADDLSQADSLEDGEIEEIVEEEFNDTDDDAFADADAEERGNERQNIK